MHATCRHIGLARLSVASAPHPPAGCIAVRDIVCVYLVFERASAKLYY